MHKYNSSWKPTIVCGLQLVRGGCIARDFYKYAYKYSVAAVRPCVYRNII